MADLDVRLAGLRSYALQCGSESIAISGHDPISTGPVHQPTTAAVLTVSAAVAAMGGQLAGRAGTTGAKVDGSATAFGEQERQSASQIGATHPTILV